MCLLAANRSRSKLIEHHSCPMHDDSTALYDDERLSGLEVDVGDWAAGSATDARRPFKLPSDRRHYNPSHYIPSHYTYIPSHYNHSVQFSSVRLDILRSPILIAESYHERADGSL